MSISFFLLLDLLHDLLNFQIHCSGLPSSDMFCDSLIRERKKPFLSTVFQE